jgi:hypothetical protein
VFNIIHSVLGCKDTKKFENGEPSTKLIENEKLRMKLLQITLTKKQNIILKKYFKMGSVVAIATCLAAATAFYSCGKDDKDKKDDEKTEWNGGNLVLPDGYAWVQSTENTVYKDAYIFKDNGSLEYYEYEEGAWSDNTFEGTDMTYETEGGKFHIHCHS